MEKGTGNRTYVNCRNLLCESKRGDLDWQPSRRRRGDGRNRHAKKSKELKEIIRKGPVRNADSSRRIDLKIQGDLKSSSGRGKEPAWEKGTSGVKVKPIGTCNRSAEFSTKGEIISKNRKKRTDKKVQENLAMLKNKRSNVPGPTKIILGTERVPKGKNRSI